MSAMCINQVNKQDEENKSWSVHSREPIQEMTISHARLIKMQNKCHMYENCSFFLSDCYLNFTQGTWKSFYCVTVHSNLLILQVLTISNGSAQKHIFRTLEEWKTIYQPLSLKYLLCYKRKHKHSKYDSGKWKMSLSAQVKPRFFKQNNECTYHNSTHF